MSFRRSMI